ncbi:MAG: T9SS type A sorting domain-containing protein, partial [Candidatus Marinimicrobia bacterium]|nr:T9SS type A sorting domain-containing protein [Candidatus Neomarinimicrobiota bacterium]
GIDDRDVGMVANKYSLFHNYPNPFNPTTTIRYSLPNSGLVSIDVYNLVGQRVETLVNEKKSAGSHKVVWDGKDSPSGIYFYRIQAGDFSQTKKMVLMK